MAVEKKSTPNMQVLVSEMSGPGLNLLGVAPEILFYANSSKLGSAGSVRLIITNKTTNKKVIGELSGAFDSQAATKSLGSITLHSGAEADDIAFDEATNKFSGKMARGTEYEITLEIVGKFNQQVRIRFSAIATISADLYIDAGSSGKASVSSTYPTPA